MLNECLGRKRQHLDLELRKSCAKPVRHQTSASALNEHLWRKRQRLYLEWRKPCTRLSTGQVSTSTFNECLGRKRKLSTSGRNSRLCFGAALGQKHWARSQFRLRLPLWRLVRCLVKRHGHPDLRGNFRHSDGREYMIAFCLVKSS